MPHKDTITVNELPVPPLHPPLWLRLLRWGCFCCTVALSIGMLSMMDQHLSSIPWVYDGPVTQYQGRAVNIEYCLLSPSTDADAAHRCSFAIAAPSVSLGLSLLWSWLQVLHRKPLQHPAARLADLALCVVWMLFWIGSAVAISVWTSQANGAGSFLESGYNWRNGLSAMAWLEVLFVAVLVVAAVLLSTTRSQRLFDRWAEKRKQKKLQKEMDKQMKREQAALAAAAPATSAPADNA